VALTFTALTLEAFPTASAIAAACDKVRNFAEATKFTTEQIDNLRGVDIRLSPTTLELIKPLDITERLTNFENVTIDWESAPKGKEISRLRNELAQAKTREKQLERKIEELEEAQQARPLDENERMFG
jgi:predicted RNase H-like nuclease (RuvC/YqgF family)